MSAFYATVAVVAVGIVGLAGLCLHWRGKAIWYRGMVERAWKQRNDFQWQLVNARHAAKLVRDARSAQASRAAKIGAEKRRAAKLAAHAPLARDLGLNAIADKMEAGA